MNKSYDEIDIRNTYTTGFWTGTLLGTVGTFLLCLLMGLYVKGYVW